MCARATSHGSRAALKEKNPFLNYGELNEFYASASLLRRGTPRRDGEFSSEAAVTICGRTGKKQLSSSLYVLQIYTVYKYTVVVVVLGPTRKTQSFDYRRHIT